MAADEDTPTADASTPHAGGVPAADGIPAAAEEHAASPAVPDGPLAGLAARVRAEVAALDREIVEIDMLVTQATSEASRHEAKRASTTEKLSGPGGRGDPREVADLNAQLLTLTKRAAMMNAQIEVLTGKQKTLHRYRDALDAYATEIASMSEGGFADAGGPAAAATPGEGTATIDPHGVGHPDRPGAAPPGVARLVLGAQEDLRREIARAIHDGPAQSLTNIVLQAQIVDRLLARDPEAARDGLRQLVSMVQATLDATKSFIFDVRPMVLDDLGLVPTLRRSARERGRRAGVTVDFDSTGADRRLSMDLESGLFRILDEALVGYLAGHPDHVTMRLDWGEMLEASIVSIRGTEATPATPEEKKDRFGRKKEKAEKAEELPPALAAMIEDRRVAAVAAAGPVPLPVHVWREIQERAATIGVAVQLSGDGSTLSLVVAVPPPA